ncbi:Spermidine export protein MdtJ [anaerobic digester metagenome]|jgi:quaternary ammonium compound-resistance protein SugE
MLNVTEADGPYDLRGESITFSEPNERGIMQSTAWITLFFAGLLEAGWALGLKYTEGFTKVGPSVATIILMVGSFYLLSRSLSGLPIGTAYAVWTGIGAVGTAIAGIMIFGESRSVARLLCLFLIVAGIVGLKFCSDA